MLLPCVHGLRRELVLPRLWPGEFPLPRLGEWVGASGSGLPASPSGGAASPDPGPGRAWRSFCPQTMGGGT